MNHISKIHKLFSERVRSPRVLEFPEEFLGENYEAVLNFWLFLDDLSEEQLRVVKERYWAFRNGNYSEWLKATDLAIVASEGVVTWEYAYNSGCAARYATRELIAMYKILEDHQQLLTFFPMFLEVL
jgi:hypothetical protein